MTLIKYSGLVSRASGKLFGSVFSSNRVGASMRTLTRVNVNPTTLQMPCRIFITQLSTAWADLTNTERSAWSDIASLVWYVDSFGKSVHLNGYNYFLSCNVNLLNAGLPYLTSPVFPIRQTPAFAFNLYFNPFPRSHYVINYTGPAPTANFVYMVDATRCYNSALLNLDNRFVNIGKMPVGCPSSWDFTFLYVAMFRRFQPDKQFSVRVRIIDAASGVLLQTLSHSIVAH